MAYDNLMVFTGNANPALAKDVVKHLNIPVGRATVDASGRLAIAFETEPGAIYSLQSRTNLAEGVWKPTRNSTIGNGGTLVLRPSPDAEPVRFYRLVAQ